jgi:hypothetical protein
MAYEIGDRVIIVRNHYSSYRLNGCVGTVKTKYFEKYGVEVDDIHNTRSTLGVFYFKTKQLEKETNRMENKTNRMEGNYRIALITFLEGTNTTTAYLYACYDDSIEIGDIVVVKSANHGIGIGKVGNIIPKDDTEIYREIICKADFTAYEQRVEARKRKAELFKQMRNRASQLHEIAIFETLAKDDAEMSGLLNELKGLVNV